MTIRPALYLIVLGISRPLRSTRASLTRTARAPMCCPPPKKPRAGSCSSTAPAKPAGTPTTSRATSSGLVDGCTLKTAGTKDNYGADTRADLVTDKEYTNFELTLDWKATKGGNSGVIYGIVEDPEVQDAVGHRSRVPADRRCGFHASARRHAKSRLELCDAGARRREEST